MIEDEIREYLEQMSLPLLIKGREECLLSHLGKEGATMHLDIHT
jgi:hypothetical protein